MIKPIQMDDETYFKSPAISKSLLSRMDCPDKAFVPMKQTPAMAFGSMAHCAILEPNDFDKRYIVDPKLPKRRKADKELWQQWLDDNQGKEVVKIEDYDKCMAMGEAIINHAKASELLSGGITEQAYFWRDERTGEDCKAKADYVVGDMIVDLKTTACASPFEFAKSVANFKYHWQDAWYSRGIGADRFIFIVIEKEAPHVIEVYELDTESKHIGIIEVDAALDKYIWHRDFERHIGYTGHGEITELSLPNWAKA